MASYFCSFKEIG